MKSLRFVAAAFLLLPILSASAKTNTWKCTLTGGNYEVALNMITAISTHEYVVGAMDITEMTIDTLGNTEARFYYIQSVPQAQAGSTGGPAQTLLDAAQQKVQDASDRVTSAITGGAANDAANTTVTKTYPTTTHAHTVEYRLASLAEVTALFQSVQTAWESGTATTYTPTTSSGGSTGQ